MGLITKLFGTRSEREIKKLRPTVDKILAMEDDYRKLSDDELRGKTVSVRGVVGKNNGEYQIYVLTPDGLKVLQ